MSKNPVNFQAGNASEDSEQKWLGFYRAKVIDSHDLRKMARVKVWIPDIMPEKDFIDPEKQGMWAHPANAAVGGRNVQHGLETAPFQGSVMPPWPGSWVWVFFENGDPTHPYYFGALDPGNLKTLPENRLGSAWEQKWTLAKNKSGRCIIISDDPDDERVELTGKKRLIAEPPIGDEASVYETQDNQTIILIDERKGHEQIMIKDYVGNFIALKTDADGIKNQLHIEMLDDIHIKSGKSIYIEAKESLHITGQDGDCRLTAATGIELKSDKNISLTAGTDIDIKAAISLRKQANLISSLAFFVDKRFSGVLMHDTCLVDRKNVGLIQNSLVGLSIKEKAYLRHNTEAIFINRTSRIKTNDYSAVAYCMGGKFLTNVWSGGINFIKAKATLIQCGILPPTYTAVPVPICPKGIHAVDAIPAVLPFVDPNRSQDIIIVDEPKNPDIPLSNWEPHENTIIEREEPRDDYNQEVPILDSIDIQSVIPSFKQYSQSPPKPGTDNSTPITEDEGIDSSRLIGLGYEYAISLKDSFRDKILPLAKASGAKYTGLQLRKDLEPSVFDGSYLDNVTPYMNYRNPRDFNDWNPVWWDRFESYLQQCADLGLTVIPTLFDFANSPNDPFLKLSSKIAYRYDSWEDDKQKVWLCRVMAYLNSSGVNYILDAGRRSYNSTDDATDLKPDMGYMEKYIQNFLIDNAGVPSRKISISAQPMHNLYIANPYSRYQSWTGSYTPKTEDEINTEEYVDGNWGGSGRTEIRDSNGKLIGGYLKYLRDSHKRGIPCLNFYKLKHFDNGSHDMNQMFAPTQRAAMRKILGIEGNGYVQFS